MNYPLISEFVQAITLGDFTTPNTSTINHRKR